MKYYIRVTESDTFVKDTVYSEDFIQKYGFTRAWITLPGSFAIEYAGDIDKIDEINAFLHDLGIENEYMKVLLPDQKYFHVTNNKPVCLSNSADSKIVIKLPVNQVNVKYTPQQQVIDNHVILAAKNINWSAVNNKEWDYKITEKIFTACESLNLSYADGKILESLTQKDYAKIIELCNNQLNK